MGQQLKIKIRISNISNKSVLEYRQQDFDGNLGVWLNNLQSYMGQVRQWRILADRLSGQTSCGLKSGSTGP